MGFVCLRDQKVHMSIAAHMDVIVARLLEYDPKVESMMLTGGFGRGEGSVMFLQNGDVIPLGDYDLVVVTDSKVGLEELDGVVTRIQEEIGVPDPFKVDVKVINRRDVGRLTPDISTYELKAASKLLYGKDFRRLIPVTGEEVSLSSGFITLSIRAMMLSKVLEKVRSGALSWMDRTWCVYQCSKAFTEICTALSLIEGFYRPSYAERATLFEKNFNHMVGLKERVPKLSMKVAEYTDIKLQSTFHEKTPWEALLDVSHYLKPSFLYFMSRYLGLQLSPDDWRRNARLMYDSLRLLFLQPYLTPLLKRKGVYFKPILASVSLGLNVLENILFIRRFHHTRSVLYLKPLISCCSPIAKTFIAANLAFYSVDVLVMQINPSVLKEAYKYLAKAYPCKVPRSDAEWMNWTTWRNVIDACRMSMKLYSSSLKKKTP